MNKFYLIHAPGTEIEIVKQADIHCPKDATYLMADKTNVVRMTYTINILISERDTWINKYNNVLKGLRYFKGKLNND